MTKEMEYQEKAAGTGHWSLPITDTSGMRM